MPIINSAEYYRLSKAISRAKKAGKDISQLLAQRQQLISEKPKEKRARKESPKTREETNHNYYQKNRYTELKKGKKLWLDLSRILQDCAEGVGDIISLMQLRENEPEKREEIESDCGECGEYKKVSVDSEKKPGVKRVNSSHLKKEPVFTPKTEPKINQILALIQQERIERILLRHEISESIRELKEQLTALKAPTHKETKRKNNLSAKTKAKIKQRKNTLSPESQEQLKNLTAGLVKYSKE
ncbi:21691_t:CDS:2 [Gigaspora margarita]|uniref:21691_t:CDS:1 n=1 Tax=Gigaspora margarita TaxID=4874 RepID=A0ABM8VV50_GIGMA|nr:21691_t:CDS:2 [Gigaspora margarita]